MRITVDAIYEHGKLILPQPLSLPEKTRVRVTIESDGAEHNLGNWEEIFAKWRGRGHLPAGKTTADYLRLTRDGNGR